MRRDKHRGQRRRAQHPSDRECTGLAAKKTSASTTRMGRKLPNDEMKGRISAAPAAPQHPGAGKLTGPST